MAGGNLERIANITSTLPIALLEKIDEMLAKGKVPSRSQVIREAPPL